MLNETCTVIGQVAVASEDLGLASPADVDQRAANGMSLLYRVFIECFNYPDESFATAINNGEVLRALRRQLEEAGYASALADDSALSDLYDAEGLQVEYTRLFDIGVAQATCSLCEGDYSGTERMVVLEEVLRYYEYFELIPPEQYRVLPDHLLAELEFLHFLAYQEGVSLKHGRDPTPYRLAQYDFLTRHPGRWVPMLGTGLKKQHASAYFLALHACLVAVLEAETIRLGALTGRVDAGLVQGLDVTEDQGDMGSVEGYC